MNPKSEKIEIALSTARKLALRSQLLYGHHEIGVGANATEAIINKLGYVQIDTLTVVERAFNHTLWTRQPGYKPDYLDKLQKQVKIFEYWGHALSYLPISDYRFYIRRMKEYHDPYSKWDKQRLEKYGYLLKPIIKLIKAEGAICSGDITKLPGINSKNMPDAFSIRSALDILFFRGDIMISHRDNFRRVYDLTERVLPSGTKLDIPDDLEQGSFLVRRAMQAYGVANKSDICDHIQAAGKDIITSALDNMLESSEVVSVKIVGFQNSDYYMLSSATGDLARLKTRPTALYILSPFDNLIIQRDRISKLFGFDYTLECYVTPSKRKYGYFCLPVIWGDKFVCRFDPKNDRKSNTLQIKSLIFEPDFEPVERFVESFAKTLKKFACLNSCEKIVVDKVKPSGFKSILAKALKNVF